MQSGVPRRNLFTDAKHLAACAFLAAPAASFAEEVIPRDPAAKEACRHLRMSLISSHAQYHHAARAAGLPVWSDQVRHDQAR